MKTTTATFLSITAVAAAMLGACGDPSEPAPVSDGHLIVRLTDAGTLIDSVERVDVFVVRIDARATAASDSDAARNVDQPAAGGWITLATPNGSFNLQALQGRVSSPLGDVAIRAGAYDGLRIVVDPSKSSVTLNSGRVLTDFSSPGIRFSSASRIGINIAPSRPVVVGHGETTTLIVDFDVGTSFVQNGSSIERNGLLFRPVLSTIVVGAETNRSLVRFINLSRSSITLQQDGSSGIVKLDVDQVSNCLGVNAAQPLTVSRFGSSALFVRLGQDLTPGLSYIVVAFDTRGGAVRIVTLTSTLTTLSNQLGSRVLIATGLTSRLDAFLTQGGALADSAKLATVLDDSVSTLLAVPPVVASIPLGTESGASVLLDLQAQFFRAGERLILVVRPTLTGSGASSSFVFAGC